MIKKMDYGNDYTMAIMWSKINEIIDVLNELIAPVIGKEGEAIKIIEEAKGEFIADMIKDMGWSIENLKAAAEILKRRRENAKTIIM